MLVYQISVAGELRADIADASDFSLDEMRDLTSHRPAFTANRSSSCQCTLHIGFASPSQLARFPLSSRRFSIESSSRLLGITDPYVTTLCIVAYPLVDQ